MKIKSQRDFWSGLMFIVIGIAFAWGSTAANFGASPRLGAAYFPFGLAILLALLGALVLFKSLTIEADGGDPIGAWAWRPLLIIIAAVALFGWAISHLGLFIALPLLVTGSALAGNEFRWKDALINCMVLTLGSWATFVWRLKLAIPLWPTFLST